MRCGGGVAAAEDSLSRPKNDDDDRLLGRVKRED